MHIEIEDVGTDVATIGLWDAGRQLHPLPTNEGMSVKFWNAEAEEGHLFFVNTGSDGGWPAHLYVDEPVPFPLPKTPERPFLLHAPTGRVIVGGVEDYRSPKPQITSQSSIAVIPSGDYAVKCYFYPDIEVATSPQLTRAGISAEDCDYYHAVLRSHFHRDRFGCALFLLFPILLFPLGWLIAGAITLGLAILYFVIAWTQNTKVYHSERFKRIISKLEAVSLSEASFVFHLTSLSAGHAVKGGSVCMSDLRDDRNPGHTSLTRLPSSAR